jgi:hypothetical protein
MGSTSSYSPALVFNGVLGRALARLTEPQIHQVQGIDAEVAKTVRRGRGGTRHPKIPEISRRWVRGPSGDLPEMNGPKEAITIARG